MNGDIIKLSPQIRAALDSVGEEADKLNANWEEVYGKALRILQGDGFEITRLQPEVKYFDTKKARKPRASRFSTTENEKGRVCEPAPTVFLDTGFRRYGFIISCSFYPPERPFLLTPSPLTERGNLKGKKNPLRFGEGIKLTAES